METKRLAGLEPAAVFGYFEEICAIPHGSRNTKMISDYLVRFAKEHDLKYYQDADDNVVLFGEASEGMEDHPAVILQGHMDMVCEKDADCTIDMALQNHRSMILIAASAFLIHDYIIQFVLLVADTLLFREGYQIVADGLCVPGAVRNGADLFKIAKYTGRFQPCKFYGIHSKFS